MIGIENVPSEKVNTMEREASVVKHTVLDAIRIASCEYSHEYRSCAPSMTSSSLPADNGVEHRVIRVSQKPGLDTDIVTFTYIL